jgi:tetratricopeptide (TPR) repeat protein
MNAYDGLGFAHLSTGRHGDAADMFRQALAGYPDHARSRLGLAAALRAQGHTTEADAEFDAAHRAIVELRRGGRSTEALLAEAFEHAIFERRDQAVALLQRLLADADLPFAGWTIPIEPFFAHLRGSPGFERVLASLAERAR